MNDRNLVDGMLRGDPDAAREFLDRYRGLFFHTISSFEANRSRRDDCFQNLTLHSLELLRRGRYDPAKGPFAPWLHRVLWCRAIDVIRKKEAKRQIHLVTTGERPPERASDDPDPSDHLAREEVASILNRVLAGFTPLDREVLRLRFVEEATHEGVAAALDITIDQAKYRLKKAVAAVRREVLARIGEPLA
ncbi:MAG TPA: sigma-70 family RNA polymerase sigma factor [Planctomycetota bacterium]|nr:sigma-70 family RNA polymerase sigma factor [Planctomycetota bacterium]